MDPTSDELDALWDRWRNFLDQSGLDWMVVDEFGETWEIATDGYPPLPEAQDWLDFLAPKEYPEPSESRASKKPLKDHSTYHTYIHSLEWYRKSQRIMKRDGFRCRYCGAKVGLQVHHFTYDRLYQEIDSDLITLCKDCHSLADDSRRNIQVQHD